MDRGTSSGAAWNPTKRARSRNLPGGRRGDREAYGWRAARTTRCAACPWRIRPSPCRTLPWHKAPPCAAERSSVGRAAPYHQLSALCTRAAILEKGSFLDVRASLGCTRRSLMPPSPFHAEPFEVPIVAAHPARQHFAAAERNIALHQKRHSCAEGLVFVQRPDRLGGARRGEMGEGQPQPVVQILRPAHRIRRSLAETLPHTGSAMPL